MIIFLKLKKINISAFEKLLRTPFCSLLLPNSVKVIQKKKKKRNTHKYCKHEAQPELIWWGKKSRQKN